MKLTKTQKQRLKRFKDDVAFLAGQQEEIYQLALKEFGLKDGSREADFVFDYCYNGASLKTLEMLVP